MSRRNGDVAAVFLGSDELGRLAGSLRLPCLDVGARRGVIEDLLPLAFAVDAWGVEPDAEECARLNQLAAGGGHPWRSLRYVPIALGRAGRRKLRLYRNRECSSLLEADVARARAFGRGGYFELDGFAEVETVPLDVAARTHGFADAVFMKLDVQGAELEILESGPELVGRTLLGIRTEVEFVPIYLEQPLWADVDAHLRRAGFVPMAFLETRRWRRPPAGDAHGRLHAPGQLAHADLLYLREPEALDGETGPGARALVILALLALTYGHADLAAAALARPGVAAWAQASHGVYVARGLDAAWRTLDRRHRAGERRRLLGDVKALLRGRARR
ncbi:MAG: FkbM family methyltransferase [Thermoleophilaceae bacterium]